MAVCQFAQVVFEVEWHPVMWALPAVPALLGVAAVVAYYFIRRGGSRILMVSILMISAFLSGALLLGNILPNYALFQAAKRGAYQVVEGTITDFHPQLRDQRTYESFTVSGITFRYSTYEMTVAFHDTAGFGGPIHAGMHVRIAYLGNRILKLEECR